MTRQRIRRVILLFALTVLIHQSLIFGQRTGYTKDEFVRPAIYRLLCFYFDKEFVGIILKMEQTLIIFSGLPGTGKSTLATQVARTLQIPIIRIDDATGEVPSNAGTDFWDGQINIVLSLAEAQLELGLSVVVDSVFMAYDRHHAQALAQKYQSTFRPIYTFVSDEVLWKQRVTPASTN